MITLSLAGVTALQHSDDKEHVIEARGATTGASIRIYRTAVAAYAADHPTVTGAVPDSELPLPTWFRNVYTVRNYVQGSKAFVYLVPQGAARVDLGTMTLSDQDEPLSAFVGIAQSGLLQTPGAGATQIVLPTVIPNGSIVFAM
ncbi:type IV pilus biogenesis protein PilM [Achromobacter insuavis]|uniref:type IV pilus biogenesis protein PilM n=1 Tax=Achromobacter insuavis TaxID=1287735 RepID=UPI001F135DC5|nr:type IV pilus biogenesis protein PilM [Achromobacter insuavis]